MITLEWQGEIGWELWVSDLKAQLKATKGEDLTVRFSSVGGSIFEGGDIFNMLADHRRDNPKAKMNLEIKSIAGSMGSLIASSPVWDNITIEPTTMFMIHNPWSVAIGDFMAMRSEADFLESAKNLYVGIYAKASGISDGEISTMMDKETWLFGKEIVDSGFADKIIDQPELSDPQDKVLTMAAMKAKFSAMKKNQKAINETEGFDKDRAVACLRLTDIKKEEKQTMVIPGKDPVTNKPVEAGKSKQEVPVENKAELMKELPGVYDESVKDGVMIERERVTKLSSMKAQDDYKDIPEVVAVIEKGIIDGNSIEEVNTMMTAAMVKLFQKPGKVDELESPGEIASGDSSQTEMKTNKSTHGEV